MTLSGAPDRRTLRTTFVLGILAGAALGLAVVFRLLFPH